ncbi:MAG: hypothetical protein OFPII_20470 [Osedax symbiont Rs1]|nr:MAG: hypothetical protein OFPII_20470 [Osedax symbiont Rs1]
MISGLKFFCLSAFLVVSTSLLAFGELDRLVDDVKNQHAQQLQEDLRLTKFKRAGDAQKTLIDLLKAELEGAGESQLQLLEQFQVANLQIEDLNSQLTRQSSGLNELFPLVIKQARDLSAEFESSLTSGQFGLRKKDLAFARSENIPQLKNIETLWFLTLQEMIGNGRLQQYQADIIDVDGRLVNRKILQVGAFSAVDETGQYLKFNKNAVKLQVLSTQRSAIKEQAQAFFAAPKNQFLVDPLKGKLLLQQSQLPDFQQRLQQGGLVGYVILGLGALGLMIAIWRILYMATVEIRFKKQLRSNTYLAANPLGRVLLAAQNVTVMEKAELLIDQAILQELHKLERGHSLLKLLAAVAPLLGLLGTVTGMIETFQSIKLLGASDPKLMAGGISQALMTTVMGLCVAIPLLFCHSFVSGKAKYMLLLLQQRSLLLLSDYFAADVALENIPQSISSVSGSITPSRQLKQSDVEEIVMENSSEGRSALA